MLANYKFLMVLSLFGMSVMPATDPDYSTYPVPPKNENTLFYIQRSKNINAIMYEANVKSDGTLNQDDPVKIYWIRYTSDGTHAPLTYLQNKYAYGVDAKPAKDKNGEYAVTFVSYDKRSISLKRTPDGKHYGAYTMINGKYSLIDRIFIKIDGGTFWFPSISYVNVIGKDPATQQPVVEKFIP